MYFDFPLYSMLIFIGVLNLSERKTAYNIQTRMMQILTNVKNVINPSRSESNDDVAINQISPKLAMTFVDRLKKNRLLNCVVENDNISDDNSKNRVGTTSSPKELFSTFSTTILTKPTTQTQSDKSAETQASIFVESGETTFLRCCNVFIMKLNLLSKFIIELFSNFILGDRENSPKNLTEMKTSIIVGNEKSMETQTSIFVGPESSNKDSNLLDVFNSNTPLLVGNRSEVNHTTFQPSFDNQLDPAATTETSSSSPSSTSTSFSTSVTTSTPTTTDSFTSQLPFLPPYV